MKRAAAVAVLSVFSFIVTPLRGQTAPQTGVQTGVQTSVQTGTQTTIQTIPKTAGAAQTGVQPLHTLIPLPMPVITPGQIELIKLEGEFSDAVAKGGGREFSSWFAEDGVTLSNGKPAVQGLRAITNAAKWDPKTYQLSWYAEGAQMGPSNDTGFTWGHYDATTVDPATGKSTVASGRYITFWKKVDGKWKVAMDASADEPPPPPGMPGAALPAATPPR